MLKAYHTLLALIISMLFASCSAPQPTVRSDSTVSSVGGSSYSNDSDATSKEDGSKQESGDEDGIDIPSWVNGSYLVDCDTVHETGSNFGLQCGITHKDTSKYVDPRDDWTIEWLVGEEDEDFRQGIYDYSKFRELDPGEFESLAHDDSQIKQTGLTIDLLSKLVIVARIYQEHEGETHEIYSHIKLQDFIDLSAGSDKLESCLLGTKSIESSKEAKEARYECAAPYLIHDEDKYCMVRAQNIIDNTQRYEAKKQCYDNLVTKMVKSGIQLPKDD